MNPPTTRASLLLRLRDVGDGQAWSEFISIYMPLLHGYAMRHGLQDSDAADIAQETLRQVLKSIGRFDYDRTKGAFRGWLVTVARNEIRRLMRNQERAGIAFGDSEVQECLATQQSPVEEDFCEREYRLRLFHWAVDKVRFDFRDQTWQAFWESVVEGEEIATVAKRLHLSNGAVYIARSRVLSRIRDEIARVEGMDS